MFFICLQELLIAIRIGYMMEKRPTNEWRAAEKWGKAVSGGETGFHVVPDVLVRGQKELNITTTEMVVLLNLLMHWWDAKKWPHPRPSVIAKRMGVSVRTVERTIKSLEKKGLVQRLPSMKTEKGIFVRAYDLSGLVEAVQKLAEVYKTAA